MSYGLTPRPELPAEDLAAVVAAAESVLRTRRRAMIDRAPNWRFSGRWFNAGPFSLRRPGPFN